MKNKFILTIGLLVALLLVAACNAEQPTDTVNEIPPPITKQPVEVNEEAAPVAELISPAQQLADENYLTEAKSARDLDGCKKIKSTLSKQSCVDIVTYELVKTGEAEDCGKIKNKDLQEQCDMELEALAAQVENSTLFDKAVDNADGSLCKKIANITSQSDCYYSVALDAKDSSLCANIPDPEIKLGCEQAF